MDKSTYNNYEKLYEDYVRVYDIPVLKSCFYQEDHHAMQYCSSRDFVTLLVPFGDPEGALANHVLVQNNLVSYIEMYSSLYGGSVAEKTEFLNSTLKLAREKTRSSKIRLEELYPVAIIENVFEYQQQTKTHRGVAFVARIPKKEVNISNSVVKRAITDDFHFSNPHNKKLFELVKNFIEEYRLDNNLVSEINYARKTNFDANKSKKMQFIRDNNISIDDYIAFKKRIVDDIKNLSPKYIIDIACGDDDIIYEFLNMKSNISVFANDIAFSCFENYHFKNPNHNKINFSNLNAITPPFKAKSFDVLFCKNLLHHVSGRDQATLIKNMLELCKTLVLVEILSMSEQNDDGRKLHHEFYKKRLGETCDKRYLNASEIESLFANHKVTTNEVIQTGNGVYKYMFITGNT